MDNKETFYFIGINGIGMSGLAEMLVSKGLSVSGSDTSSSLNIEKFNLLGITVHKEHSKHNIKSEMTRRKAWRDGALAVSLLSFFSAGLSPKQGFGRLRISALSRHSARLPRCFSTPPHSQRIAISPAAGKAFHRLARWPANRTACGSSWRCRAPRSSTPRS